MPTNQNLQSALRDPCPCHVFRIFFTGEIHRPVNTVYLQVNISSPLFRANCEKSQVYLQEQVFCWTSLFVSKGSITRWSPPSPHYPRGRNWTPGRGVAANMEVSVCFMTSQRANFPLSQASKAWILLISEHFPDTWRVPTNFPSLQFNHFNNWFTRHDRKWGSVFIFVE